MWISVGSVDIGAGGADREAEKPGFTAVKRRETRLSGELRSWL
jgi:hypothetical protein